MRHRVTIIVDGDSVDPRLRSVFIINGLIWMISCWLTLVFEEWVPKGLAFLPPIALVLSTIIGVLVFMKIDRVSKTEQICNVDGCENKVRINREVCPDHDEEVQNLVRKNRIAVAIGTILALAIYLVFV